MFGGMSGVTGALRAFSTIPPSPRTSSHFPYRCVEGQQHDCSRLLTVDDGR